MRPAHVLVLSVPVLALIGSAACLGDPCNNLCNRFQESCLPAPPGNPAYGTGRYVCLSGKPPESVDAGIVIAADDGGLVRADGGDGLGVVVDDDAGDSEDAGDDAGGGA